MQNYLEYLSVNKISVMLILSAYFQYRLSTVVILTNTVLKACKCLRNFNHTKKILKTIFRRYFRQFSLMKYFNMPSKFTSKDFSTIITWESSIPDQAHEGFTWRMEGYQLSFSCHLLFSQQWIA